MHLNFNLSKKILGWYDNNKRSLPWRVGKNSSKKLYYRLLSEFMLQQTQVKTVIPYFKKFIKNFNDLNLNNNTVVAIITPDKDIVPDSNTLNPAYLIFNNYELILQWNRSLRFALAVCTLKDKLNNEL